MLEEKEDQSPGEYDGYQPSWGVRLEKEGLLGGGALREK